MKSDWILEVLADMKVFALTNGLNKLAESLDDIKIIALLEIHEHNEVTKQGDLTPWS